MTLVYPALFGSPIIVTSMEDLLTGNQSLFPMLLDTVADETCFPGTAEAILSYSAALGRIYSVVIRDGRVTRFLS